MMVTPSFKRQGAERYAALRRRLFPGEFSCLREETLVLSELELQSLWFAGAFGRNFLTPTGEPVEVVQFGHWNHAAGPDFVDAAVRIGQTLHRGAIELDPHARDWERHGHGENPAYDQVVLHVFFDEGTQRFFTRNREHRQVAQVRLQAEDHEDLDLAGYLPADAHLGSCSYVFRGLPDATVCEILQAAAEYRLERKARRLGRTREIHGEKQALYQGMAEALGYRHNAFPMRVVSQRAPLAALAKQTSATTIDALLFGVAGFLEGARHVESGDASTTSYQRQLWSQWWQQRGVWMASNAMPLPWKTAGGRPQNHPQRRLGALAQLVSAWKEFSALALSLTLDLRKLEAFLTGLTHPYWDGHYTLKAASKRPLALIGKARARDALANQILPLHFQQAPRETWEHLLQLRASQSNEKVRRAAVRLFGEHPRQNAFLKMVYQQQALLQIYDDFCLPDSSACEDCPFPEQLWKI